MKCPDCGSLSFSRYRVPIFVDGAVLRRKHCLRPSCGRIFLTEEVVVSNDRAPLNLIGLDDIQRELGRGRSYAYEILREMPGIQVGKSKMVRREDLQEWRKSHGVSR